MTDLRRLRRAGGGAIRLLVDLLPEDWDPRVVDEEICVVFADISGYSDFVAEGGDDAAMAVLAVLEDQVSSALASRRGLRLVKRLGDGLMIVGQRSDETLDTAVTLVEAFDANAATAGWPVRLRAGAHRGPTRRHADDYFGYHVNVAARIAEVAPGGVVLATAHALAGADLTARHVTARPAGELTAKGVTGPVDLFFVERGGEGATHQLAG